MSILSNYENTLVIQRNTKTGCIPTAIEWMVQYMQVGGIDFATFQEDFDLEARGIEGNGFGSVAAAVSISHPNVQTAHIHFDDADAKLLRIRECIDGQVPCVLAVLQIGQPFHAVPIVEAHSGSIAVLWLDAGSIEGQRREFTDEEIKGWHENDGGGGRDILVWEET